MKIKQKIINEFLNKSSLNGEASNIMMHTTEEGLEAQVFYDDAIYIETKVLKTHIQDFKEGLKIPIRDVKLLMSLIKDKDGDMEIKVEGTKMLISTEKTAISYNLCDLKFIKTLPEKPLNFEYPEESIIPSSFFKSIKRSYGAIEPPMIYVEIEDNTIKAILKGEVDSVEEKEKVIHSNAKSSFGAYLPQVSQFLEDNCVVSLKDNFPIKIKSNSDNVIFSVVVSPKIKSEEKKEEEVVEEKEE